MKIPGRIIHDQAAILRAPINARRSDWVWGLPFIVGAAFIPADRHISSGLSRSHLSVSRTISDIGLRGSELTLAGLLFAGAVTRNDHMKETAFLGAESYANSFVEYALMNVTAGRLRPLQGDGHGSFWQRHALDTSFPSGHSTFTWAIASTIAHEYPTTTQKLLWYSIASTVSITRVTGLKHFPSDVIVGGITGYLIGRKIFHRHSCFQDKLTPISDSDRRCHRIRMAKP